ncbi:hypothetical protein HNY73_005812 [Argiope bruennichi]|uniref:Uncharacterized protein n=1 Tax=Argiope bruennichi TaxID=94029 RepID=A0A8T0FMS0_ARGBR|nr:hypothetical protein HNY73_005812 [Argiope bruennichi]
MPSSRNDPNNQIESFFLKSSNLSAGLVTIFRYHLLERRVAQSELKIGHCNNSVTCFEITSSPPDSSGESKPRTFSASFCVRRKRRNVHLRTITQYSEIIQMNSCGLTPSSLPQGISDNEISSCFQYGAIPERDVKRFPSYTRAFEQSVKFVLEAESSSCRSSKHMFGARELCIKLQYAEIRNQEIEPNLFSVS